MTSLTRPTPQTLQDGRWNILLFLAMQGIKWSWHADIRRATGLDTWAYGYCISRLHRAGLIDADTESTGYHGRNILPGNRHIRLSATALAMLGDPPEPGSSTHQLAVAPMFLPAACLALAAQLRTILDGHGSKQCDCWPQQCPARWLSEMTTHSRAIIRPVLARDRRPLLWETSNPRQVWPVLVALAMLLGVPVPPAIRHAHTYITGVLAAIAQA